ncbi:MAG: radical SAM protein [Candidatus Nezhaarchaeota archaeon]|nr:radical SAM protein [Candidatus Nezhaarchaeota archaeon]
MEGQGYLRGSCETETPEGLRRACQVTLKREKGSWFRLIEAIQLSRPEDYLSIYQSGCNHTCLKCHSWYFTQRATGVWMSTDRIAEVAADYMKMVTVKEPRHRATMWHATDLCRHCGMCVLTGERHPLCPNTLSPDQIVLSPQGWGPARNIVSFTGGDIACRAEFYAEAAEKIKRECSDVWVLLETNGYGLTPKNLEVLASGGVDSFWLDIKAYDEAIYRNLCGTTNKWILEAPKLIVEAGFVLEVLTLYIPGWVELDQIAKIAKLIADVDKSIPFTILAFFPEYKLRNVRSPTLYEMISAYFMAKNCGLENVKLGNVHVFAKSESDLELLVNLVGARAIG